MISSNKSQWQRAMEVLFLLAGVAAASPSSSSSSSATAGGTPPFPRRDMSAASFPHHPSREVYSLTGNWDFQFVNYTNYSANTTALPAKLTFDQTQAVPSAWDAEWGTGLQYSRGAGFYRAKVAIPAGRPARLHFQACSIFCRVFVDGAPIANSTRGGFTPFWVDVPAATAADRTVVVMASNVFDGVLTPTQAQYYDFYQYGGLLREVTLHVLPAKGPSIERVVVDPLATTTATSPEILALVLQPKAAPTCAVYPDTTYNGGDLYPVGTPNRTNAMDDCCKWCQETTGCVIWAFNPLGCGGNVSVGCCWLKTADAARSQSSTMTSGSNKPPPPTPPPTPPPPPTHPSGAVNVTVVLHGAVSGASVTLGLCWDLPAASPPCANSASYQHVNGVIALPGLAVPKWSAWTPTDAKPKLHTLTVFVLPAAEDGENTAGPAGTSGTPIDGIQVRFGLRTVQASGRNILINGVKTKLRGYNRHDMYPQLGSSIPSNIYDADLELLQGPLAGNFIRGSHYPQDPRFLDRCDERGVLVWEEALAWGNYAKTLISPAFLNASLATANAMLERDRNHPAIILWGFFNEAQSDDNTSTPAYAAMASAFRKDPTRLVTWADNRGEHSKMYEFADVISNNFYPGWYNGPASGINSYWRDIATWVATNHPAKPFIISETGAGGIVDAGVAPNCSHRVPAGTDPIPARWSLEYQLLVDDDAAQVAMMDDQIAGLALWQFSDIKVDYTNGSISSHRPGGINNKGIVDQWRTPKLAAAAVAAEYRKATNSNDDHPISGNLMS